MDFQMQTLAKRCFYRARRSATLRRVVAMPMFAGITRTVCQRILQPPGDYAAWINERQIIRKGHYPARGEKGLLSFITTVWNTPAKYLLEAAQTLLQDQTVGDFEWVVLDNGSTSAETIECLRKHVANDARVKFLRVEKNLGIIGGMRLVLSHATGRYVLPYDSDDRLYPDTVAIVTYTLQANRYPPVLYSDEDKLEGERVCWPYFKPDWDPVLFVNACFIAHLGCFDRKLAQALDVYGDASCEGCHDWDTFLRFMLAGHSPVHIPEMLYSWRMHENSTAGNINSKNFIFDSHRSVLTRFLNSTPNPQRFELRNSPLFGSTPDWWFYRLPVDPAPMLSLVLSLSPDATTGHQHAASTDYPDHTVSVVNARSLPSEILPLLNGRTGLVCLTFDSVLMTDTHWPWEALGLTELYPDAVMLGGRVINPHGKIIDAARVLGFAKLFGCPDRGRDAADPGYSAEMWKQRSVSGASSHLCVITVDFLRDVIETFAGAPVSWFLIGAWAAVHARRTGKRIIYSPFLSGKSDFDVDPGVSHAEMDAFAGLCADAMPDARYYSRHFGLLQSQAYTPVSEVERQTWEKKLFGNEPLQPA